MTTLLIVESPNKARKIAAFLGAGFQVRSSFGHIADLPPKEYGVDLETLEEKYVVRNAKVVRELRDAIAKGRFERVLLASDPDREGEAIAWHLARQLKLGRGEQRVEFREITASAVRAAVANPRALDRDRVDAQRARRVLDRIVGFDCSKEICWPAGAQSAGRCQTPALHLLCVREREILAFEARTYWTVGAEYAEGLTAFVPGPRGNENEGSETSEGSSGRLSAKQFASREEADAVRATASRHDHIVRGVESKRTERRPLPPYTTSTLQQDASRKLRLSAKQAMDAAQSLFEAGYITYHRTDSTRVADEAVDMARAFIERTAPDVLPARAPRSNTAKGAQDAHEAIRPTHVEGDDAPPPGAAATLYAMIKARFLASQSKPASFDKTTVWIDSGPVEWVAEGSVLIERGFLAFWAQYARQEDVVLPLVRAGQQLTPTSIDVAEKTTSPPSRYDEGSLIKKLESSGIGRPATFASIIATLLERDYARQLQAAKGKRVLQPTELGMALDGLMTHTFPELVTEQYTAAMESKLDEIERGRETRLGYLRGWHTEFRAAMHRAGELGIAYRQSHGLARAPRQSGRAPHEETTVRCDRCGEANYRKIARKKGRGSFLACPACRMTRDVRAKVRAAACPKCGSALVVKKIGKTPAFWGCVRYGAEPNPCTHRERVDGEVEPNRERKRAPRTASVSRAERFTRQATDKSCPKCGSRTLVIMTPADASSGALYACEDRTCNFSLPVGARRRRDNCPTCGGVVVERRRLASDARYWSCARYPACEFTATI